MSDGESIDIILTTLTKIIDFCLDTWGHFSKHFQSGKAQTGEWEFPAGPCAYFLSTG